MLKRLEQLQQASACLDPSADDRKKMTDLAVEYAE